MSDKLAAIEARTATSPQGGAEVNVNADANVDAEAEARHKR
ncbi:F0F1 ATP synthase subunit alpha [Burkholderia pseudomallei]|nr:F0F1 ATP synthase subunit alpha [Burkholderia pseudomallei]